MAYGGHCNWIYAVCDATMLVTSYSRFGEVCWYNVHIQGCWNSGRAGGAVKELRARETYKKNCYRSVP